ncbi:MAG: 16S rRNA (cytidine(1402)-2'-O)-methyltransferase [Clostridia bacterium]|nr:16S rRNA (cytidine(1402)-2'-O)-methyltransferase [Clostridia bacterium]
MENNASEKNTIVGGTLYLVATPIGNMADISERALKVLSGVDFVAAEDTRNTGLFLSRLGISKPLISYFEHNKAERGRVIADRLKSGESCALVTDAGTPAISDPGEDIVRLCAEENIPVTSIPGAAACITALTLSALSTRRFVFEGFLPAEKKERRERLEALSREERTAVVYEAPHRLKATLKELYDALGDRKIAVCRELTKLNEEVARTTLSGAIAIYNEKEPRGEYVLVIDGAAPASDSSYPGDILDHMRMYTSLGEKKMDAIKMVARDRGIPKSEAYSMVLAAEEKE